MLGTVIAVTSPLPAQGQKIVIEKGGSRNYPIKLANECNKSVKWRIKFRKLKLASVAKRKVKVPPGGSVSVVVDLDSTRSKKKTFRGSIILDCVDCVRKKCVKGDVRTEESVEVRVIDFGPFEEKADDFARAADLPVRLAGVKAVEEISQENLRQTAQRVVGATVFLGADGEPTPARQDADVPGLGDLVEELTARELVQPGQFLVETTWRRKSGEMLTTLAAADADGRVSYEPILHFNSLETLETPEPRRGSWTWGPWQLRRTNGLGAVCLDVEWTVRILTDDCDVLDPPGPGIESKSGTRCWAWNQETVHGYTRSWCRPDPQCGEDRGASCTAGEQCVTWGVFTYWTLGLSSLLVEADPGGSLHGIPVDRKVTLEKSRFGLDAYSQTVRHLCARSGEPP